MNCKKWVIDRYTPGQVGLVIVLFFLGIIPAMVFATFRGHYCPICSSPTISEKEHLEIINKNHDEIMTKSINKILYWEYEMDEHTIYIEINDDRMVILWGVMHTFIPKWKKMKQKEKINLIMNQFEIGGGKIVSLKERKSRG